jgi:hypothetical protein
MELAAGGGDVIAPLGSNAIANAQSSELGPESSDHFAAGRSIAGAGGVHRDQVNVTQLE